MRVRWGVIWLKGPKWLWNRGSGVESRSGRLWVVPGSCGAARVAGMLGYAGCGRGCGCAAGLQVVNVNRGTMPGGSHAGIADAM